jgi:hypothetical protein
MFTHPDSFMTYESPQSQAPPAWLLNMLKSCPSWFPYLKQSAQRLMHWLMPHVRQRKATKSAVQTRPHIAVLSNSRTEKEKKYKG